MRKVFYWLGVATAVVIVAAVIGFVVLARNGGKLDAESKTYVEDSVRAIAAKWDRHELLDRASPELLATLKPGDLATIFDKLTELGTLVDYEGATGDAKIANFNGVTTISAAYVAKIHLQHGEFSVRIGLIKHDGMWRINGFHVDPADTPGKTNI